MKNKTVYRNKTDAWRCVESLRVVFIVVTYSGLKMPVCRGNDVGQVAVNSSRPSLTDSAFILSDDFASNEEDKGDEMVS